MALYTAHLLQWKIDEISNIKKLPVNSGWWVLLTYAGIPARQVQDIRRNLRGKAELIMTRNTLIEHAFGEMEGSISELSSHLSDISLSSLQMRILSAFSACLKRRRQRWQHVLERLHRKTSSFQKDQPVSVLVRSSVEPSRPVFQPLLRQEKLPSVRQKRW